MDLTTNYESLLVKILPEINTIDNLFIVKDFIYSHVSSSKIDIDSKQQISCSLDLISSIKELNIYVHNSILYYEGHSINGVNKKRKTQSKNYFTKETENAIVLYNNTDDFVLKSKIYEDKSGGPSPPFQMFLIFFKILINLLQHKYLVHHSLLYL